MPLQKVCPVVLRTSFAGRDILAFQHPLAGHQLVKGTLEAGETPAEAALRELAEEAGICGTASADLGSSADIDSGQIWHFVQVDTDVLPENWVFETADDGGHRFAFFWWSLQSEPGLDWNYAYARALGHIRKALA